MEEPSFEAMTNYLKNFPKHTKDDENMSLFGGWILMASKLYRKENLYRFEDWLYCLCKVKKAG